MWSLYKDIIKKSAAMLELKAEGYSVKNFSGFSLNSKR
jgi:hypothetical protein